MLCFFVTQIVGRRHLFKGKQERERRRVAQKAATKEPAEISSVLVPRKQGNEIEVKENPNVYPTFFEANFMLCFKDYLILFGIFCCGKIVTV